MQTAVVHAHATVGQQMASWCRRHLSGHVRRHRARPTTSSSDLQCVERRHEVLASARQLAVANVPKRVLALKMRKQALPLEQVMRTLVPRNQALELVPGLLLVQPRLAMPS